MSKSPTNSLYAARNLLAVIHRDGGHHTEKVGFVQSCKDAEDVRHKLVSRVDLLEGLLRRADVKLRYGYDRIGLTWFGVDSPKLRDEIEYALK